MQTTDLNPLAQWLCHERKKHGGVRQHLADKLGINSTTLREYEIGRYALHRAHSEHPRSRA